MENIATTCGYHSDDPNLIRKQYRYSSKGIRQKSAAKEPQTRTPKAGRVAEMVKNYQRSIKEMWATTGGSQPANKREPEKSPQSVPNIKRLKNEKRK